MKALRESTWHGRSGGYDIPLTDEIPTTMSTGMLFKNKKKLGTGRNALPPLLTSSEYLANDDLRPRTSTSPPRGHSAPGGQATLSNIVSSNDKNPENVMLLHPFGIQTTNVNEPTSPKTKSKPKKRLSETEKRLMNR